MGEYAKRLSDGAEVKIGTCEDMYYLRADQVNKVSPLSGNVRPANKEDQKSIRFRFPWPDEDNVAPGEFEDYKRSLAIRGAEVSMENVEHYSVQFSALAGYLLSIPCPEGQPGCTPGLETTINGLRIARNGFGGRVKLVQQAYRAGLLVGIFQCGGCGAAFRIEDPKEIEPVIVALRSEGDKRTEGPDGFHHKVADRLAAGYGMLAEAR